ncbi:TonB-dependent receptor [Arcicella sp. DC2W]|uniref:TonB-dependent receptor n=1 Tax=Arcicella gelida TaxID=2984195 RepID=A0ABU5S6V3_9BACT|nr:TonB-dependent receptor [Arcicella sp. DC2W]MEA5403968.1 TonB-dependent receptor [Arcicella sp. DC2W]
MEKQFIKTTFFKIMRMTVIQLAIAVAFMVASYAKEAKAQEVLAKTVTVSIKNSTIKGVLKELEKESGVPFVFSSKNSISQATNLTLTANNESLKNVLSRFLPPLNIGYKVVHNAIILTPMSAVEEKIVLPSSTIETSMPSITADVTVKGKVVDSETGETLPGVTVKVKGTTAGTTTDVSGKYSISVAKGATLVFSFIGMKTQEVSVDGRTEINVSLAPDNSMLEEVAVVSDGYGLVKKTDNTGSVASMSARDLKNIPITSAAQAMTGRMAGVSVVTTDGSPDADVVIRVRGGGSLTQDNSPLYVVDGFIVNSIKDVPPSDIESINVLKDAAATAIYGAQASNGVVVITTKKPRPGRTTVSYNGFMQFKTLPSDRAYKVLSPYEYVLVNYERAKLKTNADVNNMEKFFGKYGDYDLYQNKKGTNWQDELFGSPRTTQSHNLSISGGNENTTMSLSLTNNTDQGLLTGSGYNRNVINFKINQTITKKLKFDASARVTNTIIDGAGTSGTAQLNIKDAVQTRPTNGIADELDIDLSSAGTDDDFASFLLALVSPKKLVSQDWRKRTTQDYVFNAGLSWAILKDLNLKSTITGSKSFDKNLRYYGPLTGESFNNGSSLPIGEKTVNEVDSFRWLNTLGYQMSGLGKHKLDFLLGHEVYSLGGNQSFIRTEDFRASITPEELFANMSFGRTDRQSTAEVTNVNRVSGFGRINYQFKDRYLAAITFRADASSKFSAENRVGLFPALALGWKISETKLFKNITALDELKLRASYGATGNDRIDATATKFLFEATTLRGPGFGNVDNVYYAPTGTTLYNPNLVWETTINKNLGLDFAFFKQRLVGSIDLYQNVTKDLLLQSAIPSSSGFTRQWNNVGSTSNKGVELSLTGYFIDKSDVSFSANFNFGMNRAKVEALDGTTERFFQSNWASTDLRDQDDFYVKVGGTLGDIYGYVTDGYYSTNDFASYDATARRYILKEGVINSTSITGNSAIRPGFIKLKDINGDGVVNSLDRKVIGNTLPKAQGGFGFNGRYKGLDASIFFNWSYGNDVYNTGKIQYNQFRRVTYGNLTDAMSLENRFTYLDVDGKYTGTPGEIVTDLTQLAELNANKNIWSPLGFSDSQTLISDWAVEDGSFIRLNNLNIGYSLPKSWISKLGMSQFRVYVTGNNLYLWTKYSGYDPEVSTTRSSYSGLTPGVDYSSFPRSRSYTFGVNITF